MNLKTNNKRAEKGITLIALVVTIVVLLILAGVSINAIFGQDGIIQKAKDAQNKMDQATQNDLDSINGLNEWIDGKINVSTSTSSPSSSFTSLITASSALSPCFMMPATQTRS